MNASRLKFLLPLAITLAVPGVHAAQVEVNWNEPESFTDVQPTNTTRHRFQESVLSDLEAHFRKAGESLPADQTLVVNVTDVDLAGYVEYFHPGYPFGIRVVRDIDFPRISLSYELKGADGVLISTGSDNLRDMDFRFPTFVTRYQQPLDYEKRMIDRWVREKF